jgi:hypothetical protein
MEQGLFPEENRQRRRLYRGSNSLLSSLSLFVLPLREVKVLRCFPSPLWTRIATFTALRDVLTFGYANIRSWRNSFGYANIRSRRNSQFWWHISPAYIDLAWKMHGLIPLPSPRRRAGVFDPPLSRE